jgi:arylsulfatase A-like enzyme
VPRPFQGKIALDIRDSTPDWEAFLPDKAPEGAPNVLVVLDDDTGCAAWSPYGGRIEMPTLQRLADNGLTYSQWHTTALCSPTRSVFLTGRNHHQNGFATISESSTGFPGYNSHIPRECASMATVLRDAGWSTFWVGKNHNVPIDAGTIGSSKKDWPLGQGYDRFYGFIGGETNQWYPDLPRTTITSTSRTAPRRATTCRRTFRAKVSRARSLSSGATSDVNWRPHTSPATWRAAPFVHRITPLVSIT